MIIDPECELSKADKRLARFVRLKWEQLAKADERLGRTPSNEKLLNRLRWIYDMALVTALKMSKRRQRELEN